MNTKKQHLQENLTGFAIALAWPATLCKQVNSWYDILMRWLGFNRKFFYKAGHAAVVLIDKKDGLCHYFDFGRYHSPYGHGRVRSADTDHDLEVKTHARFSDNHQQITNLDKILHELVANESCHGSGSVYGSFGEIDFDRAWRKAIEMQTKSPIKYGPFIWPGTNCSRFVRTVLMAGLPFSLTFLKVVFGIPLTPTPLNNVKNLRQLTRLDPEKGSQSIPEVKPQKQISYA